MDRKDKWIGWKGIAPLKLQKKKKFTQSLGNYEISWSVRKFFCQQENSIGKHEKY